MIANTFENYAALLVSIFRNVTPDDAFIILERGTEKNRKNLSIEDYVDIKRRRENGEMWQDIAAVYGKPTQSLTRCYYYHRKEVEEYMERQKRGNKL